MDARPATAGAFTPSRERSRDTARAVSELCAALCAAGQVRPRRYSVASPFIQITHGEDQSSRRVEIPCGERLPRPSRPAHTGVETWTQELHNALLEAHLISMLNRFPWQTEHARAGMRGTRVH